ncbi:gypsy retrotransposon integrase-like protein, partial [Trifolium medium]|nr:gypsy retrotransposon integrase-like protein [Trifolium medium]
MGQDAKEFVKRCEKCEIHGDVHNAPPTELSSITTPWPFMRLGMDLLGPFKTAPGQLKYLIVAVYYCTKWVEAEALAKITAAIGEELDIIDETRSFATIAESVVKKTSTQRYNKRVVPREFEQGDLVLRR